jgi:hypothetical protein
MVMDMHMPHSKAEALKIAQRRAAVAELYLQGRYQWEIALVVQVDQATISRDLKAIRAEWKASALRDFDEAREQELARIDALEREYWQAWQASKGEKERTATERADTPQGARMKAAVKKEQRDGNPSFLGGVQWCINKRCEVLGLDAPKQHELLGKDGQLFAARVTHDVAADLEPYRAALSAFLRPEGALPSAPPPSTNGAASSPPPPPGPPGAPSVHRG